MNSVESINLQYLQKYSSFLKYIIKSKINDDDQNNKLMSVLEWITLNGRLRTHMAHKVEMVIMAQYKKLLSNTKTQPEWIHELFQDQIEQITVQSSDDEEDTSNKQHKVQMDLQSENYTEEPIVQSSDDEEDTSNNQHIVQMDFQSEEKTEESIEQSSDNEDEASNKEQVVQMDLESEEDKEEPIVRSSDNEDDKSNKEQVVQINLQNEEDTKKQIVRSSDNVNNTSKKEQLVQMDTESEEHKKDAENMNENVQTDLQSEDDKQNSNNDEQIVQSDIQKPEKKTNADSEEQIGEIYIQIKGEKEDVDDNSQIVEVNKDDDVDVNSNKTELQTYNKHKDIIVNNSYQTCIETVTESLETTDNYFKLEIGETSTEIGITSTETDATSTEIDVTSVEMDVTSTEIDESSTEIDVTSIEIDATSIAINAASTEIDVTSIEIDETSTDEESAESGHFDKLNVVLVQSEVENTQKRKKAKTLNKKKTIESCVRVCNIDSNMNERNTVHCMLCKSKPEKLTNHYIRMHKSESYVSRLSENILAEIRNSNLVAWPLRKDRVITSDNFKTTIFSMICPFCDVTIKDFFINFYNHFSSHTGEFAYCCNFCKLQKPYFDEMLDHKKRTRKCIKFGVSTKYKYRDDQTVINLFQCEICNFVQLNSANVYKHIIDHHGTYYSEMNIKKLVIAAIELSN